MMASSPSTTGPTLRVLPSSGTPPGSRPASRDAVRFLLASLVYLGLLAVVIIASSMIDFAGGGARVPAYVFDSRDLMALLGWVGMSISGVSTIVIPNHVGRPIRPAYLPRVHLLLANVGVLGYFAVSLSTGGSSWALPLLAVAGFSYLVYALGLAMPLLRGYPTAQ